MTEHRARATGDEASGPATRFWTRRLTNLALVLVVAYTVLSAVVARRLERPDRHRPGALPPASAVVLTPVSLTSADGLALAAWEAEPPSTAPRAVVLVLHGLHGCRSPGAAAFLAEQGVAGLLLDHRAHGESEGQRTTFGIDERLDVAAAVAHARQRWPGLPLLAWGRSLGAAALLHALADPALELAPDTFDGLVLESLYSDLDSAFADRVRLHAGAWALPAASLTRALLRQRLPLDALEGAGWPQVLLAGVASRSRGTRLLLAGGGADRHAPPERLASLARAVGSRAEVVELPGVGHVDLLSAAPRVYGPRLAAFLTADLR